MFQASAGHLTGHRVSRVTILLVEDEVLVRMSLAEQLRDAGYVVLEASSAEEALDLLWSQRVRVVHGVVVGHPADPAVYVGPS